MTSGDNLTPEQRFVFDYVDRNAKAIALTGDNIFYFGELGMQEFETAGADDRPAGEGRLQGRARHLRLPDRLLRDLRLRRIRWSRSTPNTIPARTIRRSSGVAEPKFIVEGAPGHCEGHNVNAAVLVATALAAKQAMDKFGLKGTLKVFGAPGRGAARQPALFRARRLVRRRRSRLPQPHRRRIQRRPTACCNRR